MRFFTRLLQGCWKGFKRVLEDFYKVFKRLLKISRELPGGFQTAFTR